MLEQHTVHKIKVTTLAVEMAQKVHKYYNSNLTTRQPAACDISRDQPNSRFHGCDIFREIGLLP